MNDSIIKVLGVLADEKKFGFICHMSNNSLISITLPNSEHDDIKCHCSCKPNWLLNKQLMGFQDDVFDNRSRLTTLNTSEGTCALLVYKTPVYLPHLYKFYCIKIRNTLPVLSFVL